MKGKTKGMEVGEFKSFDSHDVLQIVIGACVLAVPVGFTEETWNLGGSLPLINTIILIALTLFFISIFTYLHYHREHMHANPRYHLLELTKRVIVTYAFSFVIVSILLGIIQVTPWAADAFLAFKRVVIVTFPAAIGAVISDKL